MTKCFGGILAVLLLTGCMGSNAVSNSGNLVSDDIREIDVIPMSSGRYQLYIRGNTFSNQTELRAQFKREARSYCGSNFELIEMTAGQVEFDGYEKPTLEGIFKC